MGEHTIAPGETELLVSAGDTVERFGEVLDATIHLGASETEAREGGERASAGDRGDLGAPEGNEVHAYNPESATREARVTTTENAREADTSEEDGFYFDRLPRDTIASVLTSGDNAAAPASDEYVHRTGQGVDVSGSAVSESFEAPDAADDVLISVDDADNSFEVAVVFEDADGNEVTRRDSTNSGEYSGGSSSDVFVETLIASPFVTVEVSGSATTLDYSVYAR
jgi:catechol 2,3-dioxygenase-like lactoylglutathione lyase family enzyme